MDNKINLQSNILSGEAMKNLQTLTDMSMEFYGNLLNNVVGNNTQFGKNLAQLSKAMLDPYRNLYSCADNCPPKEECPPHCLATLHRRAMVGERIVIPFNVRNGCGETKTYRVGIRDLMDRDGKVATAQPLLNKPSVTLSPYTSERILLTLDLANFAAGTYAAEIVLRENEFNQNLCLTVEVADSDGIVVNPQEEKKYKLKWQSWKSHYYCEPGRSKT